MEAESERQGTPERSESGDDSGETPSPHLKGFAHSTLPD
jgi:hypothetical protein